MPYEDYYLSFPQNKIHAFSKLHPVNKFSNKPLFPQLYTLWLPISMVAEKGDNGNTFNMFRLLMKVKIIQCKFSFFKFC